MADALVISDEGGLWELLEQFSLPQYPSSIPSEVLQLSWNPELLYFPDEPRGHVISPSIARALSGYHNALSRAYAYAAYGRADSRVLRVTDVAALDLKVLVVEGSTGLEVCEEALDRLVKGLVGKMTPRQITISVVLFMILFFSSSVAKEWIAASYEARKHDQDSHERIELSAEETKRAKILADALSRNTNLIPIAALADQSKESLTKSVISSEHARIVGADITGDQAKTILEKPHEKGVGRRLDGDYEVVEVDIENPDGWMSRLKDPKTGQEFSASVNQGELTQDDIDAMFASVREKKPIHALVNAWFLGGDKPVAASIVRATPIE